MSLSSRFEGTARSADRRFGKGTVCHIINAGLPIGRDVLNTMSRLNMIPSGLVFTLPSGIDTTRGRLLAITAYDYPDLVEVMKRTGTSADTSKGPGSTLEQSLLKLSNEEALIDFLRQKILIAVVNSQDIALLTEQQILLYDIMIDSIDVPQSCQGYLVPKTASTRDVRPFIG